MVFIKAMFQGRKTLVYKEVTSTFAMMVLGRRGNGYILYMKEGF